MLETSSGCTFFSFFRLEREKATLQNELLDSKAMADRFNVERAQMERDVKSMTSKLHDSQLRLEEAGRNLSSLEAIRNKLSGDNCDLERKLDEADSQVSQLSKLKVSLETQLSHAIKMADDEAKERLQLLSRYRVIESDREAMRQHLEDALEGKEEIARQLSRANGEVALWRAKYDDDQYYSIMLRILS